ncbi:MAG: hypothetical protein L0Z62_10460 [Gemmataceae bacterium]|nr:hypothetical protein [Gemmataceae bacterium]
MKRSFGLGWAWLVKLAVLSALALTGCRAGSAWQAGGLSRDPERASLREGADGLSPAAAQRPCRFG